MEASSPVSSEHDQPESLDPVHDSSDLEQDFPRPQNPLLEIGVVESGEDHTYKCPLCQEYLSSQKEFTMHIRAHNEVKPSPDPNDPTGQAKVYYCCLCGKMLSSFSSLDRHMLVHSGERPFSCLLCGQTFTTNGNMHRHKRTHGARDSHLVLDAGGEAAGLAAPRRGGGRKRSLPPGAGAVGRGPKAAKPDQGLNLSSPRGGLAGASRGRGGRVRKIAQQKSYEEENEETPLDVTSGPSTSPLPMPNNDSSPKCFVCKESFLNEMLLENHILSMHPGEEVSCDECNFKCPNYSYLKLHRNMFHLVKHIGSFNGNNNCSIRPLDFSSSPNHHIAPSSQNSPLSASSFLQLAAGPGLCQKRINGKPQSAFLTQQQHQLIANSCASFLGTSVSSMTTPPTNIVSSMDSQLTISSLTHSAISAAAEAAAAAASMSGVCGLSPSNGLLQTQKMMNSPNIPSTTHNFSQNNYDEKSNEMSNGQDLAEVNSIVSIARQCTSGFRVNNDSNDNDDSQSETSSVHRFDNNHSSEGSSSIKGEDPLIRDMKMRGEFPCRLCPAVYPNLRALKGHNKEHLGKAPYSCNVGSCTYSSNDKSTLTRHMRTHTGEKPFECKLCNYGFTTKANCERHLKNKHGKTSREAIRNSIIIHEPEDGPNGEDRPIDEQFRCKVCKSTFSTSAKVISHAIKEHPAYANDVDHIFEEVKQKDSVVDMEDDLSCPSMVPRANNYPILSQIRPNLTSSISPAAHAHSDNSCGSFNNDTSGPDAPLDLSRPSKEPPQISKDVSFANLPVLKLQGKFPVMPPSMLDPSNLAKLTPVTNCGQTAQAAVAAAVAAASGLLTPNFPFMLPANFPGANLTSNSSFPFLLPQFANASNMAALSSLLPNIDSFPPEIREKLQSDMKQKLQQLQQFPLLATPPSSAVDAVMAAARPPPSLGPSDIADYVSVQREFLRKQAAEIKEQKEAAETLQHLSQVQTGTLPSSNAPPSFSSQVDAENNLNKNEGGSNGQTSSQRDTEDDEANYKMVIKNGVLMKKQKQRRYRTERPYGCNYCSARFTLRSNMERHIKQQHPEHWCQKPRGSRRNHSATVPILAPQFQQNGDDEEEEEEGVLDREGSTIEDDGDEDGLVIDEPDNQNEEDFDEEENAADLVSVSKLLNSATNHSFQKYFDRNEDEEEREGDEKDPKQSDLATSQISERKKSAYSAAPHKISCPYCSRKFPWTSSLNRHILTHTGQKPYKCRECPLWFTTKSNCDRHVIRKHGGGNGNNNNDQSFTARNAPDRPYKCQMCPSSTFSSRSNLKKHQFTRHQGGSFEPADGGSSADDEDEEFEFDEEDGIAAAGNGHEVDEGVLNGGARFRCHLCQHPVQVFSERKSALVHLKLKHSQDYDLLVANGEVARAETCEQINSEKSISCLFCLVTFDNQPELRDHVDDRHGTKAETVKPEVTVFAPKIVEDKNQVKKKRANLMDKINQLTANAKSIQNIFSEPDQERIENENHLNSAIIVDSK